MSFSLRAAMQRALFAASLGLVCALSLTACATTVPPPVNLPRKTVEVSVFFSTGRSLVRETRVVDATNKYADTLSSLLKADPQVNQQMPVVQPAAAFRSVKFDNGIVTVDWDRAVLDFKAQPQEKVLAWASFLETFGQFPEVKQLQFTVEGKSSGTIAGKDVVGFWGAVSLHGQPWSVKRPPGFTEAATSSAPPATNATATMDGTSGKK